MMTIRSLSVLLCLAVVPVTATAAGRPAAGGSTFKPAVPFIQDDYTKAIAEARARKLPIFVEAWAPW